MGDHGLPPHEPHVLEPTPERQSDDQQRPGAQQMMPATSGPKRMQAPKESDATHASRTVPLLLPEAVDAAAVVDAGRRTGDGQMRPVQLVPVARDS